MSISRHRQPTPSKVGATIVLAALALLLISASVAADGRVLLLHVDQQPSAWGDSRLEEELSDRFSLNPRLRVHKAEARNWRDPRFPADDTNPDSLINWGLEMGGRYLMVVTADEMRLERKRTFSVPFVMHKYQTRATMRGRLRVVDLLRGRVLAAEGFLIEKDGPRVFQKALESDRNDPDLHLSAPDKVRFFADMQDEAARELVARFGEITGVQ